MLCILLHMKGVRRTKHETRSQLNLTSPPVFIQLEHQSSLCSNNKPTRGYSLVATSTSVGCCLEYCLHRTKGTVVVKPRVEHICCLEYCPGDESRHAVQK